jgi:hypothetical protein
VELLPPAWRYSSHYLWEGLEVVDALPVSTGSTCPSYLPCLYATTGAGMRRCGLWLQCSFVLFCSGLEAATGMVTV